MHFIYFYFVFVTSLIIHLLNDASASGRRLHVTVMFHWNENGVGVYFLVLAGSFKTKPGLLYVRLQSGPY